MNRCINPLRVVIMAIPVLLFFGSPAPSHAAPNPTEPEQFSCANVKLTPESECKALVGMYSPNDVNRPYGWFAPEVAPCNWTGIDCEGVNITDINLHLYELNSLPPEIGNLHHLKELNLDSTGLSSLPNSFVQLKSLTHVYLSNNYLHNLSPEIEAFIAERKPGWPQSQRESPPPTGASLSIKLYLPIVAR